MPCQHSPTPFITAANHVAGAGMSIGLGRLLGLICRRHLLFLALARD